MGFYARIPIRKVIINNGDFMIQELNQQLKSMYLEPRNKLRVDVNYVVGRLEEILRPTNIESKYCVEVNDYVNFTPTWQLEEFLEELKQNMENHNGN
jgi:hypothetical protein